MRLPYVILFTLANFFANAQVIDSSKQIICLSENSADCYPKVFEPKNEWQVVREGQQIPPGLHVRVNLETGLEEARILQKDDSVLAEVVIADVPHENKLDLNSEAVKQKMQDTINEYRERKKAFQKNKVSLLDLTDFDHSVDEVVTFQVGDSTYRLEQALNTLADLSHDIEFGARLSEEPAIFDSMVALADEFLSTKVKVANPTNLRLSELIFRLMGSALRNNPEAINNVLEKQHVSFVDGLFATLTDPVVPEIIHKRVLGVIHALTADRRFSYRYFNHSIPENANGLHKLIAVFPSLGSSSQVRVANIFEDLRLFPDSEKRSELDESNVVEAISAYLQDHLAQRRSASDDQAHLFFKSLLELHSKNEVPVSKSFLQWLSQESENKKANLRENDSPVTPDSYDDLVLRARHGIFGNPHARKDEL